MELRRANLILWSDMTEFPPDVQTDEYTGQQFSYVNRNQLKFAELHFRLQLAHM